MRKQKELVCVHGTIKQSLKKLGGDSGYGLTEEVEEKPNSVKEEKSFKRKEALENRKSRRSGTRNVKKDRREDQSRVRAS